MFKHLFIHRLKVLLRKKEVIFWTLIFPIALATFFNLAFSNLTTNEEFKVIDIAIIENEKYVEEQGFKTVVETFSQDGEEQVFNVQYVKEEQTAIDLLKEDKIARILYCKRKNRYSC